MCRFETSKWGQQSSSSNLQKPALDYRLYAVTDPACNAKCGRSNVEAVRQAIKGGVTLVQLREKNADGGAIIREAQQLLELTNSTGVSLCLASDACLTVTVHCCSHQVRPNMCKQVHISCWK